MRHNFSLLHSLVTRAPAPSEEPQADLIHTGSQRLLGSEGNWVKRQALLDACTRRAWKHARFRTAMDALLQPETLVSLDARSAEIIAATHSPLRANPTMTNLLALSLASGDGSLTVSSNLLMNLFSGETQTFWDTLRTNLALQRDLHRRRQVNAAGLLGPAGHNLTNELRRYVKEQVRSGRYQNENEVVRDAIRRMQQREIEQFERVFSDYPGAPQSQPTDEDHAAIKASIRRHRHGRQAVPTP